MVNKNEKDYEFWLSTIATKIRDMDIKRDKYHTTYQIYLTINLLLLIVIIFLMILLLYFLN